MYRRSQSLQTILEIRQEMARQADHDVDLFTELVRSGKFSKDRKEKNQKVKDQKVKDRKVLRRKNSNAEFIRTTKSPSVKLVEPKSGKERLD
jgi:hypothetical protein